MTLELIDPPGIWIRAEYHDADMVIVRDVIEEDCYRIRDLPRPIHFAVDIGAHIGTFTIALAGQRPEAKIAAIEANELNLACLLHNVSRLAKIQHAACTHETKVDLLSTVFPGSTNTGGSFVAPAGSDACRRMVNADEYRPAGSVPTIKLETILVEFGWPRIDVLKLDCEGSEFSILENAACLDRVGVIVGEQHDEKRFARLVERRFPRDCWTLDILRSGTPGLFRLSRPDWWNMES